MIRKTGFKTLLLAASIGLAVTGCSDTGSQRALSKDQVQFLNHLDQAKFYQKQGQLKASFQEAQNALSLNPDSLEVQLLIAENMLLAGDLRNAERYYRNLLEAMQEQANDSPQQHRSEEHTSELQSRPHLVCRLLLEKKKKKKKEPGGSTKHKKRRPD